MRAAVLGVLLVGACLLSGCLGATHPATTGTIGKDHSTNASRIAEAQRTHEYASPGVHQLAAGGSASAIRAITAFATSYINWTAQSVSAQLRTLAAASVGQARSAMSLAAAQTAQDYELQRGGIANSGQVEAIAPVLGRRDQYAVITRELTTASNTTAYQGLRPAWHLALATVTEPRSGQWVLSGWQPEN